MVSDAGLVSHQPQDCRSRPVWRPAKKASRLKGVSASATFCPILPAQAAG